MIGPKARQRREDTTVSGSPDSEVSTSWTG